MTSVKKIFVYGTLKTGEPNHHLMSEEMDGCKLLGVYKTVEAFPLVVASRYNVPYMLYAIRKGHQITGELYEVDKNRLAKMDYLECHPDYYERVDLSVVRMSDGNAASVSMSETAQAYFLVKYREELLNLPMLESYTDQIEGKKYIGPADRTQNSPYWHEVHSGYNMEEK